ncbi:MAG TPA: hypothetical protein VF395_18910 [Polyangiaceae bacterium]
MTAARIDPETILAALEQEGVKYVVIGGLAAILQGSPTLTQDLVVRARPLEIAENLAPPIAALEDVIRSKEAANRPKDVAVLPTLRTLLAEIRNRGQ